MADDFERIFDMCLDRVQAGEDLQSVLASYPAHAARLSVLLQTALQTRDSYTLTPSLEKKLASRRRFDAALAKSREDRRLRQPWFSRVIVRPTTWAAVAAVVVALLAVYIGVRPVLSPGAPVVLPISPVANPNGNFAFLVSDEVNAIADFSEVTVSIDKIGLQQAEGGKWIEITPEVPSVDLTKVPGTATQQIWRGDVPAGKYEQVFVYASAVAGTLKSSGERIDIKLPSQRLHMAVPFSISDNVVTSFTYDMTVFRTGNEHNAKYILKPQISESGATETPRDKEGDKGVPQTTVPEQTPAGVPTPTKTRPPKK